MQAIVSDEKFNAAVAAAKADGRSVSNWLGRLVDRELERLGLMPGQNVPVSVPSVQVTPQAPSDRPFWSEKTGSGEMDAELAGSRAVRPNGKTPSILTNEPHFAPQPKPTGRKAAGTGVSRSKR